MKRSLCWFIGLCGLALPAVAAPPPAAPPARPNLLFICLDDQRWDAMQFYQKMQGKQARFRWLKTPNIDRLRAQGVWFRNTFATDSLCSPSRASFLTGQYPHTHGVTSNQQELSLNATTYATLLHDAGYYTGFVGKWHIGMQKERPGFDYSASFLGQGTYYHCPFIINGQETVVSDQWVDDTSTDYAVDFLREHRDQTFMLAVAFKSVHAPCQPDAREQSLWANKKARPVPNLDVPASFQAPFEPHPFPAGQPKIRTYFECLAGADRDLGRLLDTLDELGLTANTVVIFTSDNGFSLGEHEMRGKRDAYEESMRIPFLVRAPFVAGSAGRTVDRIALNVDVAPTLLDYAGVPVPAAMQGHSLRPLVEGQAVASWPGAFLYESFFNRTALYPTMVAVRTDDAKLIHYPGHDDWTEVFRLGNDPYETTNLAGQAAARDLQGSLEATLAQLQAQLAYLVPGDSDQDTYVADAEADVLWRRRFPDERPMSSHTHTGVKGDGD